MGPFRDLSIIGCQIERERFCPIKLSSILEVRIRVTDLGWSIIIDEAVVGWISSKRMGLFCTNVPLPEADRLAWVMRRSKTDEHHTWTSSSFNSGGPLHEVTESSSKNELA